MQVRYICLTYTGPEVHSPLEGVGLPEGKPHKDNPPYPPCQGGKKKQTPRQASRKKQPPVNRAGKSKAPLPGGGAFRWGRIAFFYPPDKGGRGSWFQAEGRRPGLAFFSGKPPDSPGVASASGRRFTAFFREMPESRPATHFPAIAVLPRDAGCGIVRAARGSGFWFPVGAIPGSSTGIERKERGFSHGNQAAGRE